MCWASAARYTGFSAGLCTESCNHDPSASTLTKFRTGVTFRGIGPTLVKDRVLSLWVPIGQGKLTQEFSRQDRSDSSGPGDHPVQTGDLGKVFGGPADNAPSVGLWPNAADTINYEIATRIGPSVQHVYMED